jgi:hypothetical protein
LLSHLFVAQYGFQQHRNRSTPRDGLGDRDYHAVWCCATAVLQEAGLSGREKVIFEKHRDVMVKKTS